MPIPGGFASAPTVTVSALADPSPGVRIVVSGVAAGSTNVTVYRSSPSTGKLVVRGASNALIAGSFTVDDFEAPIGELLTYSAVTFVSSSVPSDESTPATITLTSAFAWMADPLVPSLVTKIAFGAAPDRTADIDQVLILPIGDDRPVVISGTRLRGTYGFTLVACTATDRNNIRAVLDSTPIVLLRIPNLDWDIPTDYYGVGTYKEARFGPRPITLGGRWFSFDAPIVRRPDPSIAAPLHTYAELTSRGYAYADLTAAPITYLQLTQQGGL